MLSFLPVLIILALIYLGFRILRKAPAKKSALALDNEGDYSTPVVGESNYQAALRRVAGKPGRDSVECFCEAVLVLEDDNQYDENAVRVDIDGRVVGYLSRASAKKYRARLVKQGSGERSKKAKAVIRGGWNRGGDDRGLYGVWLDI